MNGRICSICLISEHFHNVDFAAMRPRIGTEIIVGGHHPECRPCAFSFGQLNRSLEIAILVAGGIVGIDTTRIDFAFILETIDIEETKRKQTLLTTVEFALFLENHMHLRKFFNETKRNLAQLYNLPKPNQPLLNYQVQKKKVIYEKVNYHQKMKQYIGENYRIKRDNLYVNNAIGIRNYPKIMLHNKNYNK